MDKPRILPLMLPIIGINTIVVLRVLLIFLARTITAILQGLNRLLMPWGMMKML